MSGIELPLFPLNTVLFPRGPLPLRIFETRYVDMVRRCMREGSCFGVVGWMVLGWTLVIGVVVHRFYARRTGAGGGSGSATDTPSQAS
jgi:hypothetical protein